MKLLLTGKYFNERLDFLSYISKKHSISQELDATVIFDLLDDEKNNYDAIIIDENLFNTCNQTLDFAWGLHLNYPEIPTILIISPRDSYEEIYDIYKKGVLFEIIERFQIDAKSKFSYFNSILFEK
jgi:vacuolar-type H+-ATPase subunit F/Vma7